MTLRATLPTASRRRIQLWSASLAALTSAMTTVPAAAQDAPQTASPGGQAPAAEPTAAVAAATSASHDNQLEDIVVTAQKRSESLSKTPLAISALSPAQITSQGILSVQDLTRQIPNLQIGENNFLGNAVVLTIRGVTSNYFDWAGDPAVGVYLDGVYIPRTQGLNTGFFDLERVEALRGPQGTLYGRNTIGGAVNILTAGPKKDFDASADLSIGNYGDVQAHAMVNVPLSDVLAVRAAFTFHRNDGYFDTKGTTSRNYQTANDYGGRLSVLWTPSSTFRWRVTAEDFVNKGTPGVFVQLKPDGSPAAGLRPFEGAVNPYPDPRLNINTLSIRSRMDWQLSSQLSLAYIAGYQRLRFDYEQGSANPPATAGGAPALVNAFFGRNRNDNYTQEIDANFESGRLKNTLGAAYFHEETSDQPTYYVLAVPLALRASVPNYQQTAWGIYDQMTLDVTDALRVTGGIRYSHDRKTNPNAFDELCFAGTPAQVLANYPASVFVDSDVSRPLAGCSLANLSGSASFSSVTWKAGVDYDLTPSTLAYFSVSTGYKEGGLNETSPAVAYGPEKAIDYELGIKARLFNNSLSVNANVFYEELKDVQVSQLETLGVITTNAAAARVYGLESEIQWTPTRRDRFYLSANYLSSKFSRYRNAIDSYTGASVPSLDGNFLPTAPEFSMRARASHDFVLPNGTKITPAADFYYQGRSFLREFNLPIDRVPAFSRTSLTLAYTDPSSRWKAEAFVHNLEGKAVRNIAYILNGIYYGIYDPPRTVGLRVSFKY